MSSGAWPKEVCSKILDYLRERCTDPPDGLLESLAENFSLDAPVDVDPADIVHCLSFQGSKLVLVSSASGEGRAEIALSNALAEAEAKGVNPALSASALAIIKGYHGVSMEEDYYPVLEFLRGSMHPGALVGAALYASPEMGDELTLMLVFSGITPFL